MPDLDRFLEPQEKHYENALKEIRNGKKETCWMWYIFPQIIGLGMTNKSEYYGIKNIDEAIEYLNNDILGPRLVEISKILLELDDNTNINEVMDFPDNLKLKSCMTLFKKAEEKSMIKFENIFQKILDKYYNGEEDQKTLDILNSQDKKKIIDNKTKEFKEKNAEDNEDESDDKDNNSKMELEKIKNEMVSDKDKLNENNSKNETKDNNNLEENKESKDDKKDKSCYNWFKKNLCEIM